MEAITTIFESGVSPAIRWLTGSSGGAAALPPAFRNSCELLPGKLDEYIVDCLRHDEDGNVDADLEELSERTLYIKGANALAAHRAFFGHLAANRFTAIDWEKMLIAPLWALMCPGQSARIWAMAEVYADPERMALHEMYVSRALAAVGKIEAAANSYAALIGEWAPSLARAKRGGVELAADCIDNIMVLMDGAWASAEAIGVASLKGEHYNPSLFDSSIAEVVNWRGFQEGMGPMRQMVSRYKRTLSARLRPAAGLPDAADAHAYGRAAPGGGAGGAGPSSLVAHGREGRPEPKMPAPGSRVASFGVDGDWCAPTKFSGLWYHVKNCKAVGEKLFSCKDMCVMSTVATVPKHMTGKEAEFALAYCDKNHKVDSPEHALVTKQAEFFAALNDTMFQKREGRRKAAELAGDIEVRKKPPQRGGKGGGKGGGGKGKGKPFPGQAARS
jgi:hypothetical protein